MTVFMKTMGATSDDTVVIMKSRTFRDVRSLIELIPTHQRNVNFKYIIK